MSQVKTVKKVNMHQRVSHDSDHGTLSLRGEEQEQKSVTCVLIINIDSDHQESYLMFVT